MVREEIKRHLYEKYIRPTEHSIQRLIGVEIEMPVVNLSGGATDYAVAQGAARRAMEHFGFVPEKFDDNGVCFSATEPKTGDNLSFDCAYNNLELSLGCEKDINIIQERFQKYVSFLNQELGKENHTLTGMGVNPFYQVNRRDFIPSERYRMLERYLQKSSIWTVPMYFHDYPAFGAFASASQVQLDVDIHRLIPTLKAFSLVEPVKAVLFSNALLDSEPDLLCVRDLFWENSTHGINPHNIGMFDCPLESVDDLLEYICTTSIFCTMRSGRYLHFQPIPITDYLEREQVTGEYYADGAYHEITFQPAVEDLDYLRTYKFEDLTFRGTIEFRSACCQPFADAMTVAAFHVGLMDQVEPLLELMENDRVLYHHGYSAGELRKIMNRRDWPEFVDRAGLKALCLAVLDLAKENLVQRGLGEEKFLLPLYQRAETLTSPGRVMAEALEQGVTRSEISRKYAEF